MSMKVKTTNRGRKRRAVRPPRTREEAKVQMKAAVERHRKALEALAKL